MEKLQLMIVSRHVLISFVVAAGCLLPECRADRYSDYISRFAPMAVEQMELYGIPASITLAQGLLESAAGGSLLASQGNNHFGIKCHSDCTGDTMLRDDDAPDECFRVYQSPEQSFEDHSVFLTRKRYQSLFELSPYDYEAWARGLKKCGYATDPNYADRLISIIERYSLNAYDSGAADLAEQTAAFILESLRSAHVVRRGRGLHYVIANPGDTYRSIACEFDVDPTLIASYNDADDIDVEIKPWQEVYFQEKLERAPENVKRVTIGADESIHSVSQRYGMKLSVILSLNPGVKDRPGQKLKLR